MKHQAAHIIVIGSQKLQPIGMVGKLGEAHADCMPPRRAAQRSEYSQPKSGSYPVAASASGGLKGLSVGAILSLT